MLGPYRQVLTRPGAALFSGTGLIARLPISMVGLGIVLLVSTSTGSYAVAGAVSATYVVANAVSAVVQGRWIDRVGQHRVLPTAIVLFALGLGLLMTSVQDAWPLPVTYLGALLAGASLPPVGSCVRARWSHLLDQPGQLQTAFALEAVADEVVFLVGPVLVTLLATALHPLAGLLSAVLLGLAGTLWLAGQRATEPPAQPRHAADGRRVPMPWGPVALLVVVMLALGGLFGSVEVVTVAFCRSLGAEQWAGALLGLWAAGSLLAGIVTGAVHWRSGPATRLVVGALALTLLMVPTPLLPSVAPMGVALFVCGFAISPTLIAAMALVERVAPLARLTEAMGVLHTGLAGGLALGATLSGRVVDLAGPSAGFWVSVGAAGTAALAALVVLAAQNRHREPVHHLR